MGSHSATTASLKPLHIRTPLLHSAPLSALASQAGQRVEVYLKMEALQPSGSFKVRGLGRTIQRASQRCGIDKDMLVISSSGGNAGLAAAYAARALGRTCTVFVPSTTEEEVKQLLRMEGAQVVVAGDAWDECDLAARRLLAEEEAAGRGALYVHPFEGEDTIDGHATMMEEVAEQLREYGVDNGRPDVVTCSAGGSGLVRGVMRGLDRALGSATPRPRLIVTQTFGADSFGQSVVQARRKGQHGGEEDVKAVTLPAIRSKATSLGAKTCSLDAVRDALRYGDELRTLTIDDRMAEEAGWLFARDHRLLVELACSCVLAPVYHAPRILTPLLTSLPERPLIFVVVVCGGNKVSISDVERWRVQSMAAGSLSDCKVSVNGQELA